MLTPSLAYTTLTRTKLCSPQLRTALERVISYSWDSTVEYMQEQGLISLTLPSDLILDKVVDWRCSHGCPEQEVWR